MTRVKRRFTLLAENSQFQAGGLSRLKMVQIETGEGPAVPTVLRDKTL